MEHEESVRMEETATVFEAQVATRIKKHNLIVQLQHSQTLLHILGAVVNILRVLTL